MTQQDFAAMRRAMVESQLRPNAVDDARVVEAMATVPREWFVPVERATLAYTDRPVPLGNARWLNTPLSTGRLLTEARVQPGEHVLLVGAATGYAAALLAAMGAEVVGVEADASLLEHARAALQGQPVKLVEGPLAQGHAADAPYDLIFVDGAIEEMPDQLAAQLADGGRVALALNPDGVASLSIGRKAGDALGFQSIVEAESVALPGFARARGFVF